MVSSLTLKMIQIGCFYIQVETRWHKNKQNKQAKNKSSKLQQYIFFVCFIFSAYTFIHTYIYTHAHTHTHTHIYIYTDKIHTPTENLVWILFELTSYFEKITGNSFFLYFFFCKCIIHCLFCFVKYGFSFDISLNKPPKYLNEPYICVSFFV